MSDRPILKADVFPGREVQFFVSVKEHMTGCWWCQVVDTPRTTIDGFYLVMSGDDEADKATAAKLAKELCK